jgi:hypothetical protein
MVGAPLPFITAQLHPGAINGKVATRRGLNAGLGRVRQAEEVEQQVALERRRALGNKFFTPIEELQRLATGAKVKAKPLPYVPPEDPAVVCPYAPRSEHPQGQLRALHDRLPAPIKLSVGLTPRPDLATAPGHTAWCGTENLQGGRPDQECPGPTR